MLPIEPVPQGRPRFTTRGGFGRAYQAPKDAEYRERLEFLFKAAYKAKPVGYPVKVRLMFFITKPKKPKHDLPISKKDIDNLTKHILDAMNGIFLEDDGQVIEVQATKIYSTEGCILMDVSEFIEADLDALVLEAQNLLAGSGQAAKTSFFVPVPDASEPPGNPH